MSHSAVIVALALVGSGPGTAAGAADLAEEWLDWARGEGAASCPTAAEFASKVTERLGKPPAELAEVAKVRISARVDSTARASGHARDWVAEARILDAAGRVTATRRISKTAESCGPISDAIALVTALVLTSSPMPADSPGDDATQETEEEPRGEMQATRAPSEPAVATPPPPAAPPPAPRSWDAKLEAGPALQVGRLPGISFAGEAQAFVRLGSWPALFVDFAYWPESRAQLSAGGANVALWTAGLGVCPAASRRSSRWFGFCVGADVGRLHAEGFGFSTSANADQWVLDLTAAGRVEQRFGQHLFLGVSLLVAVPLIRTRVAYSSSTGETQVVFQPWPTAAMCHLGLGYALD